MHRKLTILFAPVDAVGHVNACIGIAEILRDRGHRIVFAISDKWEGKLTIHGFEEEIITLIESETNEDPAKYWSEFCVKNGMLGSIEPMQKLKNFISNGYAEIADRNRKSHPFMKQILNRIQPDLIIYDGFVHIPSLMNCGIPWVWSISCNPLCIDYGIDNETIPPSCLGLPTNGEQKEWPNIRLEKKESIRNTWNAYNNWVVSEGYPSLPKDKLITSSPYLNIYMFPEEVDYRDVIKLPSNWYQFDCFKRSANEESFEMPEKLRNRSGKLIYLSLGTMGGANVKLMTRLVSILSKCEHRFIVSKGQLSDQYELADNMWGESTVPQIKVLPIVDLVITHGGNNTVTETLFFGKPMIVMPLFVDQFDNAQRIQEKGFGLRLDPYECEETELLNAIEILLSDEKLAFELNKVSQRIQKSKKITKISELIENLVN